MCPADQGIASAWRGPTSDLLRGKLPVAQPERSFAEFILSPSLAQDRLREGLRACPEERKRREDDSTCPTVRPSDRPPSRLKVRMRPACAGVAP